MNQTKGESTNKYCRNCNHMGHHSKNCRQPITSFGVLCYTEDDDNIRYLMVKRRYSYAYVELLCGWTSYSKERSTGRLVSMTTPQERKLLLTVPHEQLWGMMRGQKSKSSMNSVDSFNKLKPHLKELFKMYPSKNNTTEWGLPKGRRNFHETDESCAVREFVEETGFSRSDFVIESTIKPLQEDYIGDDNKPYRNIYYVATSSRKSCYVSPYLQSQSAEIAQIAWMNMSEITHVLKPYQHKRLKIIELLNNFLSS